MQKKVASINKANVPSFMVTKAKNSSLFIAILLSVSSLTSCSDDDEDVNATLTVKLSISTRASSSDGYSEWENYIDVNSGNLRIYFFTNDKDDVNEKNTLIATLEPISVTEDSDDEYTITGSVKEELTAYSTFKVVVLANWGVYPTATIGVTTIDDLVEGDNTIFDLSSFITTSGIDTNHYIPFFGVNDYRNVNWDYSTSLTSSTINMLSALAKVKVTFDDYYSEEENSIKDVEIVHYNSGGYSAPKSVYSNTDYTDGNDFSLSSLHLLGGGNDADNEIDNQVNEQKTISLIKEEGSNTWVIYLSEYDNVSKAKTQNDDYSYIRVSFNDSNKEDKTIYFGEYKNGGCSAYNQDGNINERLNIYRNYYYSYTVANPEGSDAQNDIETRSRKLSSFRVKSNRVIL